MNNDKHTGYNNTHTRTRARVRRDRRGRFISVLRRPVHIVGYVLGVAVMMAVGAMVGVAVAFEPSELMAMFR